MSSSTVSASPEPGISTTPQILIPSIADNPKPLPPTSISPQPTEKSLPQVKYISQIQFNASTINKHFLFLEPDNQFVLNQDKRLLFFNETGKLLTTFELIAPSKDLPVILSSGIFAADQLGNLFGFDKQGRLLWQRNDVTPSLLNPIQAANANTLIMSEQGTELFAIDTTDGSNKWIFNANQPVQRQPSIGPDGLIYLSTITGQVYALDPQTGQMQWLFLADGILSDAPIAFFDDSSAYLTSLQGKLYALDSNGFLKWTRQTEHIFDKGLIASPDNLLYGISRENTLVAFDAQGKEFWRYPLKTSNQASLIVGNDGTIYILQDSELLSLSPLGVINWSYSLPNGFQASNMVLDNSGRLRILSKNGQLLTIQSNSQSAWQTQFKEPNR